MKLKAEKARRLNEEALRFYEPHEKQELFHSSTAKVRGLFGGNQSGKTWAGCMEIAWTVGKIHPYRPNYVGPVFARDDCVNFNTIMAVLIPTYKRILPRERTPLDGPTTEGRKRIWPGVRGGKWSTAWSKDEKMLYLADGSFIEFKSYEQGREAFQGPPRHIIREDEEAPHPIHMENLARQFTTGINFLMTMTPLNYSQWCFAEVYEAAAYRDDVDAFKMSSKENPFADLEVLEAMEKDISDPVERAARLHGEFTYSQGRVWKEYGDHNLIDPFQIPRDWHKSVIIDPHLEKPTAVNWIAEDHEDKLYSYREGDFKGTVSEICDQIKLESAGEQIDMILIDPSARQSTAIHGKGKLVDEFRKHLPGIMLANNNREIGLEAVAKRVKNYPGSGPTLYVTRNCPVTHFQMRNHSWKPPLASGESRGKPEVVKKNDDHCDNYRYRCMASHMSAKVAFKGFNIGVYAN